MSFLSSPSFWYSFGGLFLLLGIIWYVLWLCLERKSQGTSTASQNPRKTWKWLVRIVGIAIVLFAAFETYKYWPRRALQSSHVVFSQMVWVKATPDVYAQVEVDGHPCTWTTSPKTELSVLYTRLDGTGDEQRSPIDKYTDLGGGVKTLFFRSKVPTTVFVSIK